MKDSATSSVARLETERLVLRAWRDDDVGGYARIIADSDVMRYMSSGLRGAVKRAAICHLPSVARIEAERAIGRFTDHWLAHGFGQWAVEEKESGALIGRIGLARHPDWTADPLNVEVGWLLARRAWGRGLATEGAAASLGHAFEHLAVEQIISITQPANVRSERVMQRLGLSLAGRTRWRDGEVIWYAIDRGTWERRRAEMS